MINQDLRNILLGEDSETAAKGQARELWEGHVKPELFREAYKSNSTLVYVVPDPGSGVVYTRSQVIFHLLHTCRNEELDVQTTGGDTLIFSMLSYD